MAQTGSFNVASLEQSGTLITYQSQEEEEGPKKKKKEKKGCEQKRSKDSWLFLPFIPFFSHLLLI